MKNLFINRKQELAKLISGLKNGQDYILIAPRRFGKTALAKKTLDAIKEDKKYMTIRIDLMSYASGSIESVAECIIEKLLNTLGFAGKLRKMWRAIDFTFNLRLKYQDLEIEPLLHMFRKGGDEWSLLEEALELAEKIAIKEKKHLVVFYDEFGELYNLGERIIKLFRSVLQHHEHVSYLFAGSQETVMNKIFLDKSGAFYRFGELIYLKELDKEDLYQYVIDNFKDIAKDNIEGNFRIISTLLDELKGHPYYTAKMIHYLEKNQKCSYEQFYKFLHEELFESEEAYLEQQLLQIKEKQHAIDVLRIISLNLNPYTELTVLKEQQIYNVLRSLQNSGYIRKESRGIYNITDPLLSMLLIKE